MSESRSYLVVVGARPNFIKAAPFFQRAKDYPHLGFTLVHTGQHFDDNMSKVFFEQLGIPTPNIHLDIKGEFHTEKLGKMFSAVKSVITQGNYDGVIVFGDINSTLAGAVAATVGGVPLIHIESGLRSHDRRMPEEINRAITDHMSTQLFVTEQSGVDNLLKEGIDPSKIFLVGNIMIESIERFRSTFDQSTIVSDLGYSDTPYIVATIHRQENTDDPEILGSILDVLSTLSQHIRVVMPLHPGTRTKIETYEMGKKLLPLTIIEPLGYIDFMRLIMSSVGVVTDSGGIQEETTHLGIPCCTLRDNTERPITITHGSNKLFPLHAMDASEIFAHLSRKDFLPGQIPLWDQEVSKRIMDLL